MRPTDELEQIRVERSARSDDEVLAELRSLVALPDESDSAWELDDTWQRANLLVALAEIVRERKLEGGIGLVLDKMCFGDPGEMMRGMRHSFEAAVSPHWDRLAAICVGRLTAERAGTRLWALDELGVLRDPTALPAILERFTDDHEVALEAFQAAAMTLQEHPNLRPHVVAALRRAADRRPDFREGAAEHLASIQRDHPVHGRIDHPEAEARLVAAILQHGSNEREIPDALELLMFRCLCDCGEYDGSRSPDGILTTRVQLEPPGCLELRGHVVWLPGSAVDPIIASIRLDSSRRAIESATIKLGDAAAGPGTTPYGAPRPDPAQVTQWVFVFEK